MQNGPQRVFVALACTPWVFRREGESFVSHTGQPAGALKAVHLDEEGNILLETELGIGLLDDRDLPQFLGECRTSSGQAVDDEAFGALMETALGDIRWHELPLQTIRAAELPARYKFNPNPQPA